MGKPHALNTETAHRDKEAHCERDDSEVDHYRLHISPCAVRDLSHGGPESPHPCVGFDVGTNGGVRSHLGEEYRVLAIVPEPCLIFEAHAGPIIGSVECTERIESHADENSGNPHGCKDTWDPCAACDCMKERIHAT